MKAAQTPSHQSHSHIRAIALLVGLVLLIPLLFTLMGDGNDGQGWNWKFNDFLIAGALLFSFGMLHHYLATKIKEPKQRLIAVAVILLAFALLWIEMAVGLFGSPISGS